MQIAEIKTKLEEKIRALENEKAALQEEARLLKEVAELNEKATTLESDVNKLREEVEALRQKLPPEFLTTEEMPWKEALQKTRAKTKSSYEGLEES
ncbi:MAG: hypothetical protein QXN63_00210 [Candidatus Bathyarchaeia archaeon]